MEKIKKYFIADFYKSDEDIQARKNEIDKKMESTLQTIKQGKVYAKVDSVSRSGMSRKISFYRVKYNEIENITPNIAWLCGAVTPGKIEQGNKFIVDEGLKVSGCGMDMIFHTLYSCMPYSQSKKWNQHYKTL